MRADRGVVLDADAAADDDAVADRAALTDRREVAEDAAAAERRSGREDGAGRDAGVARSAVARARRPSGGGTGRETGRLPRTALSQILQPSPMTVPSWIVTFAPRSTPSPSSAPSPSTSPGASAGAHITGRRPKRGLAAALERGLHRLERLDDAHALVDPRPRERPGRDRSRKSLHAIASGSRGSIRGIQSRRCGSRCAAGVCQSPLSKTVTLRSGSMSSKTAILREPITVILRILCGSSHDRCRWPIWPARSGCSEDDVLDPRLDVTLARAHTSTGSASIRCRTTEMSWTPSDQSTFSSGRIRPRLSRLPYT